MLRTPGQLMLQLGPVATGTGAGGVPVCACVDRTKNDAMMLSKARTCMIVFRTESPLRVSVKKSLILPWLESCGFPQFASIERRDRCVWWVGQPSQEQRLPAA